MPALRQLEAYFVRYEKGVADEHIGRPMPDGTIQWGGFEQNVIRHVETFAEAQGVWFLCPLCFAKNGGAIGTHYVDVTFEGRGAKDDEGSHDLQGRPSRWSASGSSLDDLSCSPSVLLLGPGCGWHGYITSGGAQ